MADILQRDVADLLPPFPNSPIGSPLSDEQLDKLGPGERKELEKLSSKESRWLREIAKAKPQKVR